MKLRTMLLTVLLACSTAVFGQTQNVRGKITSADGEPLMGAAVAVKGTTQGTVADIEGNYSIDVKRDAVLQFSFFGYTTAEKAVAGKSVIDVVLEEDVMSIDEVVVVGYGTMKKSDLTGAVISANMKDFEKSPNTNVLQSLQGTVPGLNVGQVSSAGSSPSISIRGKNTISGNTSVLVVLDGIIFNGDMSSINPGDIESVDILKDASATAVYGAQAANGVILITTKKGKAGKANVTFSSSYSVQSPTNNLTTMNRSQMLDWDKKVLWAQAYTEESGYTEENPAFDLAASMPDAYMRNADGTIVDSDYDWWDQFTRQGKIQENKLSVSGGNQDVRYLISLGNMSQENFLLNDDFSRNSIRVNIDANPYKWLTVGVQAFGSFMNRDGQETYLPYMVEMSPLAQPYDEDGNLIAFPMYTAVANPFHGTEVSDRDRTNELYANLYTEIQLPVKGLKYRLNYGNEYVLSEHFYASDYDNNLNGGAYKSHSSAYNWTLDNILSYNRSFGRHDINATFVYGASSRNYYYTKADSRKFARMTLGYNSLELGSDQYTYSDAWDEASLYQMARVNYKFANRYLITATVRRDGFSGFAENNKFATFPSVALGWTVSEEDWYNFDAVNILKLRGGWGISGNKTSRYSSLAQVSSEIGYIYGDVSTGSMRQELTSLENADLKWEKTAGINLGIDFGMFDSRISGSIEYYNTKTNDLLFNVSIPSITGFTSIASNVGQIQNKGIELILTSHNITTKDFEWSTTFNISHNNNKVLSLTGEDADGDGVEDDMVASSLFIGESLSAIYDYKVDGIYQVGDDIPEGYHPGNYRIVDTNEDGQITADDRTIIGYADPKVRMGLLNNFRYKSLTLSFFFNAVLGGKDGYLGQNTNTIIPNDNAKRYNRFTEETELFWSPLNTDGIYGNATADGALTGRRYEKRDFLRLQDVTLGYDLPSNWIKPLKLTAVNVYMNCKNLLTLTGWHGWDPEPDFYYQDGNQNSSITRASGSCYQNRPVMKSVTGGIVVTF